MTPNDVRKECLECHMTSNDVNDVKGECHITMMTSRCVKKPDQTEPVGCYKKLSYIKFREMYVNKAIISYICFVLFVASEDKH